MRDLTDGLARPTTWNGRGTRFASWSLDNIASLEAVNRGEFSLKGLRNRDLQALLYPGPAASDL